MAMRGVVRDLVGVFRLKGGPGSGHRGHAGRPGSIGGSLPGTASVPGYTHAGVHGTSHARTILEEGFSIATAGSESGYGGLLGVGVYIDTSPDMKTASQYGDTIIGVRIRDDVMLYDATARIHGLYTSATDYGNPAKITKYLQDRGYGGIKTTGQTVIFDPKDVQAYSLE